MVKQQRSLLSTGMHAFTKGLFVTIGIGLAFILVIALLGLIGGHRGIMLPENHYVAHLMPDGQGKRHLELQQSPLLLQIDIVGPIGTPRLNGQSVEAQLQQLEDGVLQGRQLAGVLLYINSPGGTTFASDAIYRLISDFKERMDIPVYAYVDGLCASGGLYVALAADKIFSNDVSLVGSVGTLMPPFFNYSGAMDKVGVTALTISAGTGKDALNPTRPWAEGEGQMMRDITDFYYDYFVELVIQERPQVNRKRLVNELGAQVFPAPLALEYGFIDEIGHDLQSAVSALADRAGLSQNQYQLVRLTRQMWLSDLVENRLGILSGQLRHKVEMPGELESELQNQLLYMWQPRSCS